MDPPINVGSGIKDIRRVWQVIIPVVGVSGIAFIIGFLISTAHFRMLGVRISILNPVDILEITGEFIVNTVRIFLDSEITVMLLLVAIVIAVIMYYGDQVVPKVLSAQVKKIKIVNTYGKPVRHGVKLIILILALTWLLLWIVVFVNPVMHFTNLLMLPSETDESISNISRLLDLDLNTQILISLKLGDTASLKGFYQTHLLLLLIVFVVIGQVAPKTSKERESLVGNEVGKRDIITRWPHIAKKMLVYVFLLHIFLLPVIYGVIAKEPIFPNVVAIIDPMNLEHDDIFGLHKSFKYSRDNYLLYQDERNTYLYNIKSRRVTILNTSSIYAMIHISQSQHRSILALVQREKAE